MLFLDHTFTKDEKHQFLKKLEKSGFRLAENEVVHPGKVFCRFIYFIGNTPRTYQYLEFVHIGKGGEECSKPGISFGYRKGLKSYYDKLKRKFNVRYSHKNYEWKKDSKRILPGWNFVTFKNLKIKGFFPWITEYEKSKAKQAKKKILHPNGVKKIVGLHFDINAAGKRFFEDFFGKKIKDSITLSCGTTFYFNKAKSNKLNTVHLECKNLNTFKKKFPYDEAIQFLGKEAVVIKNPSGMWDINIT